MKIVWVGHISENCGHGQSSRDYINLLDKAGIDVYGRNIQLHEQLPFWGEKIVSLCSKPKCEDPDIFLVHKAPWNQDGSIEDFSNMPEFVAAKKRIFMTIFETSRWPDNWKPVLEKFDSIITACTWQRQAAINLMGVAWASKIHVAPHVVEPNWEYKPKPGPYVFFSEFSRISDRKGLDILLKAYFHAFDANSNVVLRLKIGPSELEKLNNEIQKAKKCFNWRTHPKIDICSAFLKPEDMPELWDGVDCYVCSARGEGFALSLAQAAVNGLSCAVPVDLCHEFENWHQDFLEEESYNAIMVPVLTQEFADVQMKIDTSAMAWLEPNPFALSRWMKEISEKPKNRIDRSKTIEYLSSQNVLSMLKIAMEA